MIPSISGSVGPLTSICNKATRLAPDERYGSAEALAEDVENYLADERIEVHQDSFSDRVARVARRNRGAVMTAVVGLALSTAIATMAALWINQARNQVVQLRADEQVRSTARLELAREVIFAMQAVAAPFMGPGSCKYGENLRVHQALASVRDDADEVSNPIARSLMDSIFARAEVNEGRLGKAVEIYQKALVRLDNNDTGVRDLDQFARVELLLGLVTTEFNLLTTTQDLKSLKNFTTTNDHYLELENIFSEPNAADLTDWKIGWLTVKVGIEMSQVRFAVNFRDGVSEEESKAYLDICQRASAHATDAVKLGEQLYEQHDPHLLQARMLLALTKPVQVRPEATDTIVEELEELVAIVEKSEKLQEHPFCATLYRQLGGIQKSSDGLDYLDTAKEKYSSLFGPAHPETIRTILSIVSKSYYASQGKDDPGIKLDDKKELLALVKTTQKELESFEGEFDAKDSQLKLLDRWRKWLSGKK